MPGRAARSIFSSYEAVIYFALKLFNKGEEMAMSRDPYLISGPESEVLGLRSDLEDFLRQHDLSGADLGLGRPEPVRRRLTDPAPLGHEQIVMLLVEFGLPILSGVLTGVLKDTIMLWVKDQAAKRGLRMEKKD